MTNPALVVLLAASPCVVLLLVAAYVMWLERAPELDCADSGSAPDWPDITVIVAVFNESVLLRGKLENLTRLTYPRDRLRFVIVDGGSTDGSRELAADWSRMDERFLLLATTLPNKAAQLNVGLRHARASWIVVTDADALMPANTLESLMTAARDNPALAVIGSPVLPVNTHPAEQMYWRLLNWLRFREWCRGSASIVMAPCYAFRQGLIDRIPDDVVSDDVYVAWRIGCSGQPIGLAGPVVHEMRGPGSIGDLFRQKVRRGSGMLHEAFRFLPETRGMMTSLGAGVLVRFALLLLSPTVVVSAAVGAIVLANWLRALDGGWVAAAVSVVSLLVATATVDARARRLLTLLTVLPLAASVAVVTYPFVRQFVSVDRFSQLLSTKIR